MILEVLPLRLHAVLSSPDRLRAASVVTNFLGATFRKEETEKSVFIRFNRTSFTQNITISIGIRYKNDSIFHILFFLLRLTMLMHLYTHSRPSVGPATFQAPDTYGSS